MTPTSPLEEKTKNFIVDTVQEYWKQHEKVCMLSTLGFNLKESIPDSKRILGEGLSDYLRQNSLVHVVQFPNINQKIGAVPLSIKVPDDPTSLFKSQTNMVSAPNRPIYMQEFWNSFIRRIEDGQVRCITLDADRILHIRDVEQDEFTEGTDSYLVEAKDLSPIVPGKTDAEKASATHNQITNWITSKALSHEMFVKKIDYINPKRRDYKIALLLGAFEGLPDADLARISIPLDILSKLTSSK